MDSDTVIAFDLDGTLTESKVEMDDEMADLIVDLSKMYRIAIITGGTLEQIKTQVLAKLPTECYMSISLFPTSGAIYAKCRNGVWASEIANKLSTNEKIRIKEAFIQSFRELNYPCPDLDDIYGKQIEDRETQITYSHFGQAAPLNIKFGWDRTGKKRLPLMERLQLLLPDMEIKFGGQTSIDVTKKGIDKAYSIRKISEVLHISEQNIVFVGDALYPGGNDSAVLKTGAKCYEMADVSETKQFIRRLLNYEI